MPRKSYSMFLTYACICISTIAYSYQDVYIIIHGTWACGTAWANPSGTFFDTLEQAIAPAHLVSFTWSGNVKDTMRERAAQTLIKLIQSYPPHTHINLITHSHGSNVGIIASQKMGCDPTNHHHIRHFFAMGTPVAHVYQPNMSCIKYFYNIFSFEDMVQTVAGLFERVYPPHPRIANIRLFLNGKEPGHADIHDPLFARVIPQLPSIISHAHEIDPQAPKERIDTPSILSIESLEKIEKNNMSYRITYTFDNVRETLLARDRYITQRLINSLWRNEKNTIVKN